VIKTSVSAMLYETFRGMGTLLGATMLEQTIFDLDLIRQRPLKPKDACGQPRCMCIMLSWRRIYRASTREMTSPLSKMQGD